jgi:hypothetical protein
MLADQFLKTTVSHHQREASMVCPANICTNFTANIELAEICLAFVSENAD